jgi:ArsR family transcriptional regulator, arsenate/arsenite/antimonite-responsive transcriptional repressor
MNAEHLAKIAQALSDPTRLAIFAAIAAKKEMNCGEITCEHELAPGTVSHHLRTLAEAGLIECRRDGQFIYNRMIPRTLKEYAKAVSRIGASARSRSRRH